MTLITMALLGMLIGYLTIKQYNASGQQKALLPVRIEHEQRQEKPARRA